MQELLKKVEEFFNKNPHADFEELENFLNNNFTKEQIDKYFEFMGETLGGIDKIMDDPMEHLLSGAKEQIHDYTKLILIEQPSPDRMKAYKVKDWDIWEKEESEFDWNYESNESCYIIEGEAEIFFQNQKIHIKSGDFITFKKDLKTRWKITKRIKKYYTFDTNEILEDLS